MAPLHPLVPPSRARGPAAALAAALLLAACSSAPPKRPPPVVDRSVVIVHAPRPLPSAATAPAAPPVADAPAPVSVVPVRPGPEHRGLPGYYTVRPGDTLVRIGLDQGQNWRDIARWSLLDNPHKLDVGQVLRVRPPEASAPAPAPAAATAVAAGGEAAPAPVILAPAPAGSSLGLPGPAEPGPVPVAVLGTAPPPAAPMAPAAASAPAGAASAADGAPLAEEDLAWAWPAGGPVLAGFEDTRSKGVVLGGKLGDPVLAAADGRVVYAGSGLRGYGNLIIVKHNSTYLSAYAHNQVLLVKEDQPVRRGQRIAEMGSSDASRVQLHFEIRKQGKPTDPTRLLPPR